MPGLIRRVQDYIRRYGLAYMLRHTAEKAWERVFRVYDRAWRCIQPTEEELRRQREQPIDAGLISIVAPIYNTRPELLTALADSFLAQTYPRWEACLYDGMSSRADTIQALDALATLDPRIRVLHGQRNEGISGNTNLALDMARGDWIVLCDHDDLLTPDALYRVAEAILANQPDMIYSDEDKVTEDGARHTDPHFKPDFCPDNLRSGNYICHLMAMRRSLLDAVGGLRPAFDGSQDHDLALRIAEHTDSIVHLPRILYHWRTVSSSASHQNLEKCIQAARRAVEEHTRRIGWPADVTVEDGMLRLHYAVKGRPRISVILMGSKTDKCREALAASAPEDTEWLTADVAANRYAAMNQAAARARGDMLLFVDETVLPRTPGWMTELMMYAQRDDVGAVTPVMWNRRGRVTHGGFAVGMKGAAVCRERGLPRRAGGWHLLMRQSHNVAAVSALCLMIRRDHFIPFDERYHGGLGAVDWCLRLGERGLRHVFTPHAGALCQSRAWLLLTNDRDREDEAAFRKAHDGMHDPCYSAWFSRERANGSLSRELLLKARKEGAT